MATQTTPIVTLLPRNELAQTRGQYSEASSAAPQLNDHPSSYWMLPIGGGFWIAAATARW